VKDDKVDYEPAENRAPIVNESDSDGGISLLIV